MIPPRLRAGLVIGAVAIASAIAGAAVDRSVMARRPAHRDDGARRPSAQNDSRRRQQMLERMTKELALTSAQRAGLDSIFQRTDSSLRGIRREMQPRLQKVFEESRTEIAARLDSAQRVKFAATHRQPGPPRDWR